MRDRTATVEAQFQEERRKDDAQVSLFPHFSTETEL
jgi:hypothetical protein